MCFFLAARQEVNITNKIEVQNSGEGAPWRSGGEMSGLDGNIVQFHSHIHYSCTFSVDILPCSKIPDMVVS